MYTEKDKKLEGSDDKSWSALGLAWQLGYMIAVPLVVLALVGRMLDSRLGTSPWLLLTGIFLSIFVSTMLVYRKAAEIIGEASKSAKSSPRDPRRKD